MRLIRIITQYLIALMIVLFFAVYGHGTTIWGSIKGSYLLVMHTIRGLDLVANYWEVYPPAIWYSTRLILLATFLGATGGILLSVLRVNIKARFTQGLVNGIVTVFESIPDDMYVIIAVIMALFLYEHMGLVLPLFPDTSDPSFADTVAPAIALALPSGFYMQRVIHLRLREERTSQYVITALSKGMTYRRVFFKHVLPNVYPAFFRNIPIVAGIVISSAIFAEFFFGYHGLLDKLLVGSGWTQSSGLKLPGYMLGGFIPEYQPGTIWLIGALVVTLWFIAHIIGTSLSPISLSSEFRTTPSGGRTKIQRTPVIIGTIIILFVLTIGTFPHLITPFSPSHVDYGNINAGQTWPLVPSLKHPFGTDDFGRDMLSLVAYGTWPTIGAAVLITVIALTGSVILAVLTYVSHSKILSTLLSYIGTLMISMPVLYIAYLLLYPRNQSMQSLMKETHVDIIHQMVIFILGIAILEIGRGSYSFHQAIAGWAQFNFMEGVQSLGRRRSAALFTHLRSWLVQFGLEYAFVEFVRVLSILVQLAALHIFMADKFGYVPFTLSFNPPIQGSIPAHNTWFGLIGEISNQYTFISYVWLLYAPVIFILSTMIGANLIGRGLRGQLLSQR